MTDEKKVGVLNEYVQEPVYEEIKPKAPEPEEVKTPE
jgi:hypothetical protein